MMLMKVASVIATAVFGLLVSLSAVASKPVLVYEEVLEDFVWPYFECDGFTVMANFDAVAWETDFYDKDGNRVKTTVHQRIFNNVLYNSENPAIMFEAKSDVAFAEWSYEDGIQVEYRERGVFWHLMDGGEKIMFVAGIGIWNPDDGYFHRGQLVWPSDVCALFAE